jgi:hypothetical protein
MNASQNPGTATSARAELFNPQLANASAFDCEPDHSALLDLMSGNPDDVDAFFERMFAD